MADHPAGTPQPTETVVIIGAGSAGLTAAYALSAFNIKARVLEQKQRVGDQWRQRHPQLTLNTHRDLSAMPNLPYPPGTKAFPKRDEVASHLETFVQAHNISVDYDVNVLEIRRDGDAFVILCNRMSLRAWHVIVATGRDRCSFIPAWTGLADYKGKVIHSASFGDAQGYAGQSILVVGAGNSGIDVLNHLSKVETGKVWLSFRRGPSLLPRRLFGLAVQRFSPVLSLLSLKANDAIIAMIRQLAFGNLKRFGLPNPRKGAATRLAREQVAIAVDDGAIRMLKAGRITVVPEVASFDATTVTLANGQTLQPDVVIAATGYRAGLETMLAQWDVLNEKGVPRYNGNEQASHVPGLWFMGMRATLIGDFPSARKQALGIAQSIAKRQQSFEPGFSKDGVAFERL